MARTQMRLDAITGSLVANDSTAAVNEESLQGVLDRMVGSLERHHGGEWYSQPAGVFSQPVQIRDSLNVTGSADIDGDLNVDGGAVIDLTLAVAGDADLDGALDVAGAVSMAAAGVRTLLRGDLKVDEAADLDGALDVAGAVALGASGGAADTSVRGDLSVAEDATISGDLTVTGDFRVNGALTYVNTTDLLVEDQKIVVALSGSALELQDAGIYLGTEDASAPYLRWDQANSRWQARAQMHAPVLQSDVADALYMKSDADGDLISGTASQLVTGLANQFTGSNIAYAESSGVITYSISAGTGVSVDNAVIAIGQAVGTGDSVEFAGITDSSLTALRLMASDASKGLVSADLAAWVAGTANQVVVTDDTDGSITLSLPQNIHSAAQPEFAALNIGTAHDMEDASGNLMIKSTGELHFSGSGGSYELAAGAEHASFESTFAADTTIIGSILDLASKINSAQPAKFVERLSAPVALTLGIASVAITGFNHGDYGASDADKDGRFDVFVNGQLLTRGASDDFEYGATGTNSEIDFKFALEADDVISVVIR